MRGVSTKTIARLLRFNRAVRSLDRLSGTRANEPVEQTVYRGQAT